jgi:hypothetical protein
MTDTFDQRELAVLKQLRTPDRIQRFLDEEIGYNKEPNGETCYSPRQVLRHGVAHCMEGAMLAAAALRVQGHPPLLVDLEAEKDDDHVLAVFRINGGWGAIGKSNYSGLRFREPIYRTVRELVMSYFEHYYNLKGVKSLRRYSLPVRLTKFDSIPWMTAERDVWEVPNHLCEVRHFDLLTRPQARGLVKVDDRLFRAGRFGGVGFD